MASASLLGTIAAMPALAQTTAPAADAEARGAAGSGTEILVTARKREERLVDVPISITAFGADDIENKQITDLGDVASLSPNVTFQAVGGRNTPSLFIRGVYSTATVGRLATTAVFQDGIYVLGGIGSVNTADVSSIEVLKGPQNAYFGRNTFAGAINLVTADPADYLTGKFEAEATHRGSFNLTGVIEGPLAGDIIRGRLVASANQKAAMYTANDGGALGEETTKQISGTLVIEPSSSLKVRLRAAYQYDKDGPAQTGYLRGSQYGNDCSNRVITGGDAAGNQTEFAVTMPYFCGSIPGLDELGEGVITSNTSFANAFWDDLGGPGNLYNGLVGNSLGLDSLDRAPKLDRFGMARKMLRLSASVDYEISDYLSTVLNVGYNKNDTIVIQDTDRTDEPNVFAAVPAFYEDFSAELRLQSAADRPLRWMLGGNYYNSDTYANFSGDVTYQVRLRDYFPQSTGPVAFSPQGANSETADVWAVFGSVEYDIFDSLTVSGELRYQYDKSRSPSDPEPAIFKDWLPRFIVKYQPTPDWSMYASYSKGVLPGQFNTQYMNATPEQRAEIETILPGSTEVLPSQQLKNYEVGMKQSLYGGKLQWSLALYLMKWANLPSSSAVTGDTLGNNFTALITSGDATFKGVEFEGTIRPADGLTLGWGISWQQGKYDSYTQGLLASGLVLGLRDFEGKHLPRIPDWTGNVTANYEGTLSSEWDWYAGSEVKYTGSAWDSEANIVKTDSFFRVNSRVGVRKGDLSFELFAKNLFNDNSWDFAVRNVAFGEPGALQHPFNGGYQFMQGLYVGAPDKREIGVRVKQKF
ncbi:TonB-dependent receptor [Novosphingobium sp. YJ-S2-02]|uniref:TonB-dependent receptor n=2 Tax=Novosphingobium aureum TaxID=2792964 RepID=A0A931HED6_9SPHN|nr:TonB-dependent receptor [Novosphingobium aureum]